MGTRNDYYDMMICIVCKGLSQHVKAKLLSKYTTTIWCVCVKYHINI